MKYIDYTLAEIITLLQDHAKLTPAAEEQLERLKNNPPKVES